MPIAAGLHSTHGIWLVKDLRPPTSRHATILVAAAHAGAGTPASSASCMVWSCPNMCCMGAWPNMCPMALRPAWLSIQAECDVEVTLCAATESGLWDICGACEVRGRKHAHESSHASDASVEKNDYSYLSALLASAGGAMLHPVRNTKPASAHPGSAWATAREWHSRSRRGGKRT
jgi:hypothetical protein